MQLELLDEIKEQLENPELQGHLAKLSPEDLAAFQWRMNWLATAHNHQIEPAGDWYTTPCIRSNSLP